MISLRPRSIFAVLALVVASACSQDEIPPSTAEWRSIAPQELSRILDAQDVMLINVHVPFEGDIPETDASIPYSELASRIDELPEDPADLVIYCRSGNMSSEAAEDLVDAGYTGFGELEGGSVAWQAAGLPYHT